MDDRRDREENLSFPPHNRFLTHTVERDFFELKPVQVRHRRIFRVTRGSLERNEIERLKKQLPNNDIIQIFGSWMLPGSLVWPPACCHLTTFFEDVEELGNQLSDKEEATKREKAWPMLGRLNTLLGPASTVAIDYCEDSTALAKMYKAALARVGRCYGCILSAISYLHGHRIHPNELNPDKILLSRSGLWLIDFDTNPNILESGIGATNDNMWPRAMYIAPESAAPSPIGPSANIFSLGCIFFEMTTLCARAPMRSLSVLRSPGGRLSRANVEYLEEYIAHLSDSSVRLRHMLCEIKQMLDSRPEARPAAVQLMPRFHIISQLEPENTPLFGLCCTPAATAFCEHLVEIDRLKAEITALKNIHWSRIQWMESQPGVGQEIPWEWEAEKGRLLNKVLSLKNLHIAKDFYDSQEESFQKSQGPGSYSSRHTRVSKT